MNSVTLQPLGIDYANILHMEAMYVPFHMGYGGLICSKMLQSYNPIPGHHSKTFPDFVNGTFS